MPHHSIPFHTIPHHSTPRHASPRHDSAYAHPMFLSQWHTHQPEKMKKILKKRFLKKDRIVYFIRPFHKQKHSVTRINTIQ
jgi:hypothetical protein